MGNSLGNNCFRASAPPNNEHFGHHKLLIPNNRAWGGLLLLNRCKRPPHSNIRGRKNSHLGLTDVRRAEAIYLDEKRAMRRSERACLECPTSHVTGGGSNSLHSAASFAKESSVRLRKLGARELLWSALCGRKATTSDRLRHAARSAYGVH